MSRLVIVESPTKAKTISKFLGDDYKVISSYGHIRDLPTNRIGVDIENNFEPQYVIPPKAKPIVKKLKDQVKKSSEVILATDEDREGEAIAWHLAQVLGFGVPSKAGSQKLKTKRIVFHEITKRAIEKALQNPREINEYLVDAQRARRVLDRLVGYKLSPFLWKKVARGLSAGRVQSVAVRLIVEREEEIRKFVPREYWNIIAVLKAKNGTIEAQLAKIGEKSLEKFDIPNKEEAQKISADLSKNKFTVSAVTKKELTKNPPPPFITSTLQQAAVNRLGYSSKKTMFFAQRLYEKGLITYMRTDSVNLSEEALRSCKKWLDEKLGEQYSSFAPRRYFAKSRLAQEAHEAIRPTDPFLEPESAEFENNAEKRLYTMIWQRFIASQMPPAKIAATYIDIKAGQYLLRAAGQQVVFDGFTKIWPQQLSEKSIPDVKEGDILTLDKIDQTQHFTEPPPRYTEAALIKVLEEKGIGRPSTYAPTISTIQERGYVVKEKGRFAPTEVGELVTKLLVQHFPTIVNLGFTAKMEGELDEIADGKKSWRETVAEFYGPFSKNLEEKYKEISKKEVAEEETSEICNKCGKPMIIKYGRFGKFMACSGFPACKNTKRLPQNMPQSTGLKCPVCKEGDIVERKVSKGKARGRKFWGCSMYPNCKYATWDNPTKKEHSKN